MVWNAEARGDGVTGSGGEGVGGSPSDRNNHFRERSDASEREWASLGKGGGLKLRFQRNSRVQILALELPSAEWFRWIASIDSSSLKRSFITRHSHQEQVTDAAERKRTAAGPQRRGDCLLPSNRLWGVELASVVLVD